LLQGAGKLKKSHWNDHLVLAMAAPFDRELVHGQGLVDFDTGTTLPKIGIESGIPYWYGGQHLNLMAGDRTSVNNDATFQMLNDRGFTVLCGTYLEPGIARYTWTGVSAFYNNNKTTMAVNQFSSGGNGQTSTDLGIAYSDDSVEAKTGAQMFQYQNPDARGLSGIATSHNFRDLVVENTYFPPETSSFYPVRERDSSAFSASFVKAGGEITDSEWGIRAGTAPTGRSGVSWVAIYDREMRRDEIKHLYKNWYDETISAEPAKVYFLPSAGAPTLHALSPDNVTQLQGGGESAVLLAHSLQPNDVSQVQLADAGSMALINSLSPSDAMQLQGVDSASLVLAHVLGPEDVSQLQVGDAGNLITAHLISPSDVNQVQQADATVLQLGGAISPEDANQDQAGTSPTITVAHLISPEDVTQIQSADGAVIIVSNALSPDDVNQLQNAIESAMALSHGMTPEDVTQNQSADSSGILSAFVLSPEDVVQIQTASFAFSLPPGALVLIGNVTEQIKLANGTLVNVIRNSTNRYKVH